MKNNLVSIIVPCYNQGQYLSETLESVLNQSYQHWECIIVNDGSTDNTEEIALEWLKKNKRFKYFYKHNGGLSSTRNFGIKYSSGEFILPLDSDDLICDRYLQLAIQHFKNYPQTKLVYSKAELFGESTGQWNLSEYNYDSLLFENMLFCSAIFKKNDYDRTTGYDENLIHGLEDWDFWISFLNESDVVYCIPEVCFYYRFKNKSMIRNLNDRIMNDLTKQIVKNHKEKYDKFFLDIINLHTQVKTQLAIIDSLNLEIKRIRTSKEYRLSKFILNPYPTLKALLKQLKMKVN